jgi:putative peptidoglycan lipid II flippase
MGYLFALRLPGLIGLDPRWGVACLTVSSSLAAWVEFILLRHTLNRRIGRTGLQGGRTFRLFLSAALAAAAAWGMRSLLPPLHPILLAALLLSLYGGLYVGSTLLLRAAEIAPVLARLQRRRHTP